MQYPRCVLCCRVCGLCCVCWELLASASQAWLHHSACNTASEKLPCKPRALPVSHKPQVCVSVSTLHWRLFQHSSNQSITMKCFDSRHSSRRQAVSMVELPSRSGLCEAVLIPPVFLSRPASIGTLRTSLMHILRLPTQQGNAAKTTWWWGP